MRLLDPDPSRAAELFALIDANRELFSQRMQWRRYAKEA